MQPIDLNCPTCTQKLQVEPEALRARMPCPRCGADFVPIDLISRDQPLPAIPATRPPSAAKEAALAEAAPAEETLTTEAASSTTNGAEQAEPKPTLRPGERIG